jgi:hypothetical protein
MLHNQTQAGESSAPAPVFAGFTAFPHHIDRLYHDSPSLHYLHATRTATISSDAGSYMSDLYPAAAIPVFDDLAAGKQFRKHPPGDKQGMALSINNLYQKVTRLFLGLPAEKIENNDRDADGNYRETYCCKGQNEFEHDATSTS